MTREYYENIFRAVDEDEKALVSGLIDECIYCEKWLAKLKKEPPIVYNPKNRNQSRITPAARLYKQYLTSYTNAIRVLLNVLRKVESAAQDDLLRKLEEFSLE